MLSTARANSAKFADICGSRTSISKSALEGNVRMNSRLCYNTNDFMSNIQISIRFEKLYPSTPIALVKYCLSAIPNQDSVTALGWPFCRTLEEMREVARRREERKFRGIEKREVTCHLPSMILSNFLALSAMICQLLAETGAFTSAMPCHSLRLRALPSRRAGLMQW